MQNNFTFFMVPKAIYEKNYANEIGVYGISVYLCLLFHKNNKTGDCFPSEETLAKKTGMTRNSVRKHIKSLLDFGIIERIKKVI